MKGVKRGCEGVKGGVWSGEVVDGAWGMGIVMRVLDRGEGTWET